MSYTGTPRILLVYAGRGSDLGGFHKKHEKLGATFSHGGKRESVS